jgi:protein involved in polysaccharide export with SLBB domain
MKKILIFVGTLLLAAGCEPEGQPPRKRFQAPPAYLTVAPVLPQVSSYPEFDGATEPPEGRLRDLPTLPGMTGISNPHMGLRPISMEKRRDGQSPVVAMNPGGLDPAGRHPIEQLIYGGAYPEHDAGEECVIRSGDKLHLRVEEHEEFSGEAEVGQDGTIRIPHTEDRVAVAKLTRQDAAAAVAKQIARYIKGAPEVEVRFNYAQGDCYYIFGEVHNQGRFPMGLTPIRLREAILRANSKKTATDEKPGSGENLREDFFLSPHADLRQVSVITPHRSRPSRREYNVKSSLLQGRTGEDPVLKPGDIVFVPSTTDKKIIGLFYRVILPVRR